MYLIFGFEIPILGRFVLHFIPEGRIGFMKLLNAHFNRYLLIGFGVIIIMILGLGIYSFQSFQKLINTARLLSHSATIISHTDYLLSLAIEMETSQRGFVITGDESFLRPYYRANDTIKLVLNQLKEMVGGSSSQSLGQVESIKDLLLEKNNWNGLIIDQVRENFDSAKAMVSSGKGRILMDSIRQSILKIQNNEHQLIEARNRILGIKLMEFQQALAGLLALVASLAVVLYILMRIYLKERSRDMEELNKSSEEIKNLYDLAPCGYLSVDDQILLTSINQTLLDWMGYTRADVIGKMKYHDLLSDESRAKFEKTFETDFKEYVETGYVMDLEFDFKRKDGSLFPVLVNSAATFDDSGKFLKSRTTVFDNSKRKKAERELATAYGKIRDLYDHAPCGYHSLDNNGVFVDINETELAWLGYSRDELIGKMRFQDILTVDSKILFSENFPVFKKQGFMANLEFELVRKDLSTFFVLVNASAIYDKNGNFVQSRSTVNDHTARKEAEIRAVLLFKELEAFTYSVSHDLRAPLRSIDGYAKILEEDYGSQLDSEGKRTIGIINRNARRMGQLIDDLLEFSRMGRMDLMKSNVDLDNLIAEIIEDQMAMENGRKVDLKIKRLGAVKADRKMLKQVWINLISNAFKYSRMKGHTSIEIGRNDLSGEARFFIKDNGAGFDMQYSHKLFEVFQRLHRVQEFEGTGVGLAIVKRIINRHGGQVWAEGIPEQGATFSFSIPNG